MSIQRLSEEEQIDKIVELALAEDLGQGDVTTDILIPDDLLGKAHLLIKEDGVISGLSVAEKVFKKVDPSLSLKTVISDGARVKPGDIIATVSGKVASILKAERTALNFLQRLSGIATLTSKYADKLKGSQTSVVDTRKTSPGLRLLEKYAVKTGGGKNHRLHLGDGILIKDNHLLALRAMGMSLKDIVAKARENAPPGIWVEVEVTSESEAKDISDTGADIIMFDNMKTDDMRRARRLLPPHIKTEASGGITLETIRSVAESGVDIISVGALTHSPRALNLSLELDPESLSRGQAGVSPASP